MFSQKQTVLLAPPSLSLNSGSEEWEALFYLFFLPTNWLDSKEKFEDSLPTFKIGGTPHIQSVALYAVQLGPG